MKRFAEHPEKFGAALVALFAFVAIGVYAAGFGGGARPVKLADAQTCDRDLWDCSAWNSCASGYHNRDCVLSYDCAAVATPKPPERESCSVDSACDNATWRCDDWQQCANDGKQYRKCQHIAECPNTTARPVAVRDCQTVQCDQPTLHERVACRLGLSETGLEREDALQPLPELCATLDSPEREACVARHLSYEPCHSAPSAEDRLSCARTVLGVTSDVAAEAEACDELALPSPSGLRETGKPEVATCREALRAKVNDLVLFRLLDLELRAKSAKEKGADVGKVVDLITAVEETRAEFARAESAKEKESALEKARQAWQSFQKETGTPAK